MDHLELQPLVNKGNVVINSNTKSSLCSNENAETFLNGASLEELQVPSMSSSTAATATPSSGGADHNAGHQPRIHLSRDDIAPLLALYFKQTHNFSIEGLPNSDEVPSAQSLQKNEQVVIPVSCCFGWCNGSNETATTINTDLVIAIQNGSLDQVKQLLDVDGLDVNLREANGLTYLHRAVFNNQVEIAKCLLSKGAEVGVLGGEVKSTPLHVATEKGYLEMVKVLVQHYEEDGWFGKQGCTFVQTGKNYHNQDWYKCETCSFLEGNKGVCSICVRTCHGDHEVSYVQYSPFFCDCGAKGEESCNSLTKKQTDDTATPQKATTVSDSKVSLFFNGPYKRNSNGSSALALAVLYGHTEITEYLLNKGFDVNSRDKGKRTPLHYAVLGNQIEISRLLISKGAIVDAIGDLLDQNKSTPLHLAVRLGDSEMVQLLEEKGADFFMIDSEGHSGLQLATDLEQDGIVTYLQQAIVKRESEFTLKWDKVFQDKPILMSELKCHIETVIEDPKERENIMQSFSSVSEIIQVNRKRKVTFHEWTNWLKQDRMKLSQKTQSALTVQQERNPDFPAWQKFFFDASEGTMQITFEQDLKKLVVETDYKKLLKEFKMSKPQLEYYIRVWSKKKSQDGLISRNQWIELLHYAGTDRSLYQIDWTELKIEFDTWKSFWQEREVKALLMDFAVALLLLAASGYDVGLDIKLAHQYIGGDYYTHKVQNQSDPSVMNCSLIGVTMKSGESVSCEPDCSWLNQEFDILNGNQTTENFQYSCFEQDLFWGGFTLSFTFLPGVALLIRLLQSKEVRKSYCEIIFAILSSLIYPLTLFAVKITSLFQFGEEWKRVATLVTACESQVESFLQAGLQMYVIFSRPDRETSVFQLMAVLGSFVMIGFGQAKAVFANKSPGATMFEDIKKTAIFTVLSFVAIFFFIFTAVFIAIIDKILFFASYGIMAVIMALTYLFLTRCKSSCLPQNDISKSKLKWITLSAAFLIGTIAGIIGLVMFNMDPDSYSKTSLFQNQLGGNILLGLFSAVNLLYFIICLFAAIQGVPWENDLFL